MKKNILLLLGIISIYHVSYAMLPQPHQVQLPAYDNSQDVLVNNELQCLTCYTANGINLLKKSKKLKNEPLDLVARQELDAQKKLCVEFKDSTLLRQKARRNAVRQIARINRALAGRYQHKSVCVNLTEALENA